MTKSRKSFIAGLATLALYFFLEYLDIHTINFLFANDVLGLVSFISAVAGSIILIKAIGEADKSKKFWKVFTTVLAVIIVAGFGITIYVNYALPHGPSYPTGGEVCTGPDGHERCGPEYREDLRGVPIPEWAKFIRADARWWLIGFWFLGAAVTAFNNIDNPIREREKEKER